MIYFSRSFDVSSTLLLMTELDLYINQLRMVFLNLAYQLALNRNIVFRGFKTHHERFEQPLTFGPILSQDFWMPG